MSVEGCVYVRACMRLGASVSEETNLTALWKIKTRKINRQTNELAHFALGEFCFQIASCSFVMFNWPW